jgi:hypothetical protein
MINKELATDFVKKYPHMMLALASNKDSEKFFIEEIEKLLDKAVDLDRQRIVDEMCDDLYQKDCEHDWIIIHEYETCILTEKGKVFNQINECKKCGIVKEREVIYSNIGVGLTPIFEGVFNG